MFDQPTMFHPIIVDHRLVSLGEGNAPSSRPSRADDITPRISVTASTKRPTDQRGQLTVLTVLTVLTDEGFAVLAVAAPGHVAAARRAMFDHLTPDQVRQFAEIGEAIIKGLTHEDDYQAELPWRRR